MEAWLTKSVSKMRAGELAKACNKLVREGWMDHVPSGADGRREAISAARSRYWDDLRAQWNRVDDRIPSLITASECNKFLASLPPVPLWPDRCDCPVCRKIANA